MIFLNLLDFYVSMPCVSFDFKLHRSIGGKFNSARGDFVDPTAFLLSCQDAPKNDEAKPLAKVDIFFYLHLSNIAQMVT